MQRLRHGGEGMRMAWVPALLSVLTASTSALEAGPLTWDFIVVGAGTGGSLCAGRLAAAGASVLLLEAGKWDQPELYETSRDRNIPAKRWAHPARLPGQLTVQNDQGMRNHVAVGYQMGGTSSIHGDVYDRPPDREFEYGGIRSWDGAAVRAAYSSIEEKLSFTFLGSEDLDVVPDAQYWVISKLLEGTDLEHQPRPVQGSTKAGLSAGWWFYRSCEEGTADEPGRCRRHTSYSDFVGDRNSSRNSPTVLAGALVTRVLLQEGEAVGVEVSRRGMLHEAFASYGVVLAAGALGTPKILMLSGVGDPYELQRLGVPVQLANREVGQGLADHLAMYTWFMIRGAEESLLAGENCRSGEKFHVFFNSTGPLTGGDGPVDSEVRFFSSCNHSRKTIDFGIEAILLDPASRGRVYVPSARAEEASVAEFPSLWEEDYDRLEAVLARLATALGMDKEELVDKKGSTLAQDVRARAYLSQHFCCSARVAPEGMPGVLDEQLRVRGLQGLYVGDASALPFLPSAHTSSTALLTGELAARSALEAYRTSQPRALPAGARRLREELMREGPEETSSLALPVRVDLRVPPGVEPVSLPMAGLGTGTIRSHRLREAVASFLRMGGRHVDTAVMYDNYEAIRQGLEDSGIEEEIVVTFKMMPLGRHAVQDAVAAALAGLKRKRLEVALLHWPGDVPGGKLLHGKPLPACVDEDGSWRTCRRESYGALIQEQRAGRVGAIGVSNFALRHLDELQTWGLPPPAVHQLELHPQWHDDDLLERAIQDGTRVQGYGCLGGAHTGAALLRVEGVQKIAKRRGLSPAQVLLRWAVQLGASVITGGSSEAHLRENLHLFHFQLELEEMMFLSSEDPASMHKSYGPEPSKIP